MIASAHGHVAHLQPKANSVDRRRFLRAGAAGIAATTLSFNLRAYGANGSPMRILCSGPSGSVPDLVARAVADQLLINGGQRAVVENRPGAAGQISVVALAGAAADGATLLLAQGAIATVYPYLYTSLSYDPDVDIQPVSLASEMALALAIGPAVPQEVKTLDAFIVWLREHPAQANVGSPGTGTLPHLLEAMLLRKEGVAWQHVAYGGGPPAVKDLLGGQIAALALPEGLLQQHHAAGRLRVLATSGAARSSYLPTVASFVELGHPELVVTEWFAFFAPARVPRATIEATSTVLRDAIAGPELAAVFASAGMVPGWSTPSSLAARIAREQRHWQTVLRTNDIHAD